MKNVLERLLNLLAFLLTVGRAVTADEIRQTVSGYGQDTDAAFRRMFERDKDMLRTMGIPLDLVPATGAMTEAGYRIDPSKYALADAGLTDQERAALWLASQVVRIDGRPSPDETMRKLGGIVTEAAFEPLSADLGSEVERLGALYEAIAARVEVEFGYSGRSRSVRPHGLGHRRGHWYLVGVTSDGTRVFRVDRMADVSVSERTFERDPSVDSAAEIDGAPWEAGAEEPVKAVVRVDPDLAWWAERRLGGADAEIHTESDGGVRLVLDVVNAEALVGWVLGFGPSAEIVSPPELRAHIVERIRGRR